MPVRFRCRHCHQLLGIAHRKIGTEVNCPTCHNKVVVPAADAPDADRPTVRKPDAPFEGSDLDVLLQPSPAEPAAASPPTAAREVEPHRPPGPPAAAPSGLTLSPFQATVLTVATVLLLALFFAAGLLIGRYWF